MFGIIVNPVSGCRRNTRYAQEICAILERRGEACCVFETQAENDGARQTRLALEAGCSAIVCVGGDGTLSEVVSQMAGSGRTLYVVPCGTGNDFARVLGLHGDPVRVFTQQLAGRRVSIDCGSINGKPFLNVAGSGFDVEVLRKTEELRGVYPGPKAYRKAVMVVLSSYRALEAEVSIDGGAFVHKCVTIIEVANGRCIGGGMRVAPGADVRDGLFDVVTVDRVPRRLIPFLLPLFILGLHVHLPIAHVVRAKEVTLRCQGMVVNIDGGLEEMDEAVFAIMPGALEVMLPGK